MFSGIVDHCGIIKEMERKDRSLVVWVESQFDKVTEGESIAVDGVCLTVTQPHGGTFRFDLSPETCSLTTAQGYDVGTRINLEKSLRLSDRLGGHFVMGHVDETAQLIKRTDEGEFLRFNFDGVSNEGMPYIVKKGSVSVNGVSLTINDVTRNGFEVMLIPHTLERTNLGDVTQGGLVNIEYDWIARVIVTQWQREKQEWTKSPK